METSTALFLIVVLAVVSVALGTWILHVLGLDDRLDTKENLEARERMLDEAEKSFWKHAGEALRSRSNHGG